MSAIAVWDAAEGVVDGEVRFRTSPCAGPSKARTVRGSERTAKCESKTKGHDLMNAVQLQLEGCGKAASRKDTSREEFIAARLMESSTGEIRLMESICERENMSRALKRVEANDGAPGIDGMSCRQLRGFVRRTWQASKQALSTTK